LLKIEIPVSSYNSLFCNFDSAKLVMSIESSWVNNGRFLTRVSAAIRDTNSSQFHVVIELMLNASYPPIIWISRLILVFVLLEYK
jgi:hypothetical protein